MDPIERMIRERAYELWDRAGRPNGRSDEFWFAARYELERREETGDTQPPVRLPAEPPRQESAADWRVAASPASRQGPRGSGTSLAPRNIRLATLRSPESSPAIARIVRNAEDGARQEFAFEGVMR